MPPPSDPRLIAISSALPEYSFSQDTAKAFAREFFAGQIPRIDSALEVFDTAGVRMRRIARPIEWHIPGRSFEEKTHAYIEMATELSARAITDLLNLNGLASTDIDHLVYISTTGLATPSIDARLIGKLGMRANAARTPVWGWGCAGGALGLGLARDILLGKPQAALIAVNVELCSLTFHSRDFSMSNLVACALFGDATTAALVVGAEHPLAGETGGAAIVASGTTLWPDSLDVMGWNFVTDGLQVVFAKRIPAIVREKMREAVDEFLSHSDVAFGDIKHFLPHPGGQKILTAYQETFELDPGALEYARAALRDHGNCSSCSVTAMLGDFLRSNGRQPGALALVTAPGPGFCVGNALLRL